MSGQTYIGLWLDYSQSPPAWVLTLPDRWGSLLVSGLTTLVGFAAAAAWTITAFALHQTRSNGKKHDTLFFQIQVLLRNSSGPAGFIWNMLRLGRKWRHNPPRNRIRRILAVVFWATFILSFFTAAGILVGKIASPPEGINNVRLKPSDCGIVDAADLSDDTAYSLAAKVANDSVAATTYVDTCYHAKPGTIGCSTLPIQRLKYSAEEVDCPFGGVGRCHSTPIRMVSADINSNDHLGINDKRSNSVVARLSRTCSVLSVKEDTRVTGDPAGAPGAFSQIYYNFGPVIDTDGTVLSNWTNVYSTISVNASVGYTMISVYSIAGTISSWRPDPDFNVSGSDVTLHFFAPNSVRYVHPVTDPLFSANGTYTEALGGATFYLPDQYTNVLGCADQYQYCDAINNKTCTPWAGYFQSLRYIPTIGLSSIQQATAERINVAAYGSTSYNIVTGQNAQALQANKRVQQFFSPGVPSNQWQIEVGRWFEASLANIQARIVDYVVNAWADGEVSGLRVAPASKTDPMHDQLVRMCNRQRVRSSGQYQNFSFAGVLVVAIVSAVIIVLSWTLGTCVARRKDRRESTGSKRHKFVASVADTQLNLLRAVLEKEGLNGWDGVKDDRPWRVNGVDDEIYGPWEDATTLGYRVNPDEEKAGEGDAEGHGGVQQARGISPVEHAPLLDPRRAGDGRSGQSGGS